MANKRFCTIHFLDGTKLTLSFPPVATDDHQIAARIRQALDARSLAFEVSGELFFIPTSSVKYFQIGPTPEKLPDNVIKGATLQFD